MKTLTKTMHAMAITSYGNTSVFKEMELPKPSPQKNQILVKVYATSINPVDYKIRQGHLSTGVQPPQILGFDVSGVVEETGEKAGDFKIGDEVYYLPKILGWQGAYAEYHLVEEEIVSLKPTNLKHIEAAAIPLVACTAWDALIERLKIKLGETVLIHAGAGGVGSIAIQLAKSCGSFVYSTCSTKNLDFVRNLGADKVIDYKRKDFVSVILKETKGEGVDVIFDTVGSETLTKSFDVAKYRGRIASIVRAPADFNKAFLKNIAIHPVFVQGTRHKLDIIRDLIEIGKLKPVIDSIIKLQGIPKAHEKLEAGGIRGKIVVDLLNAK